MLKIKNMPIVSGDAIGEEFNIDIFECEFTEMAENDSYVTLKLNDKAVKNLKDSINWQQSNPSRYLNKLRNQLNLVEKLRELGYTDEILVFVSW